MRLGPFELFQPLAVGGMSEVWSAWHVSTGVFAAVKLIPPERVDALSRKALQREIRTAAALDHPGIVWVYDQGTVSPKVAAESDGKLVAGSPYLVMEYASFTLRNMLPVLEWGELRTILVGLLDALAHAHARGVIHRDLKPGNVLVCGPEDLRPGLKLTDFGIAHALDATDPITGARKVMGPPRYMAPEQVDGDWRSMGPGTDLYSLGCLTFRCISGHGPFRSSGTKLLLDHLRRPAPPLELPPGFPPELKSWVAWLLEKDPARRPSSAAVAMDALPPGPHLPLTPGHGMEEQATAPMVPIKIVTLRDRKRTARRHNAPLPGLHLLTPPSDWRRPKTRAGKQLRDAGRALLGLRPIPMAGRVKERDHLWTALRQGTNRGQPVGVALIGHAGLGRSRLLDWFTERASELGCATVFHMQCRMRVDPGQPLRKVLDRFFLSNELEPAQRKQRLADVQARLGILHSPMLALALAPNADLDVISAGTLQFVERLRTKGPVLFVIDDIHHHPGLFQLASDLLNIDGPVIVVLSAQEEALADDPLLRIRLLDLVSHTISLEPLEGEDWSTLIHSVLPLSPTLAATVAERTKGYPHFAVELLTDWVQRDVLIPTKTGFEAPPGLEMPDSVRAIWSGRLRRVLRDLPATAAPCLELAATLGMEVDFNDLRALLKTDEAIWQALITRLGLNRLTVPTADGFAFSHPALREVILQRAKRSGRLQQHHHTIAEHLEGRTDPSAIRRRGRHRAAAGQKEAAFHDLFLEAHQSRTGAGIDPALVLCEEAERLLDEDAPRKAEVISFRARVLSTGRNYSASRATAHDALELAKSNGWTNEIARARVQLWVCCFHANETSTARRHFEFAISALDPDQAPSALGLATNHLAWILIQEDELPGAMALLEEAATHYGRSKYQDGRLSQLMVQADRANLMDDLDTVEDLLNTTWELALNPPQLMLQLHVMERRAYLASRRGDFDTSRRRCEELLDLTHALSAGETGRLRVLLGYVCLEQSDLKAAVKAFQTTALTDDLHRTPLERNMVFAGLVACQAEIRDPAATDNRLNLLEMSMQGRPPHHPLLEALLERALANVVEDTHHSRLALLLKRLRS